MRSLTEPEWPSGLFVHEPPTMTDTHRRQLASDVFDQKIVLDRIQRLYDLDLAKVQISGFVGDTSDGSLFIAVRNANEVLSTCAVENIGLAGNVVISPRPGEDIAKAKGRDLGELVARNWLEANGYAADYPAGVELTLRGEALSIEVVPAG